MVMITRMITNNKNKDNIDDDEVKEEDFHLEDMLIRVS